MWDMKSNKKQTLWEKIRKNFFLRILIFTAIFLLFLLAMAQIISLLDFQWVYDVLPEVYYEALWLFSFLFDGTQPYAMLIILFICLILILGIAFLSYRLLKKTYSYISALEIASSQLLDKNVEYIQLPAELADISTQMNHLKHEAEKNERLAKESEQKKNDLIVYLAHDLKTPLTSVIGYLELLKETPDLPMEQRVKYTNITLEKAYRLEDLMNEFFEIAKFNDTNLVLMKKNLNLKFLLQQLIDEFYPVTNEQGKKIIIHCEDNLTCLADPDKLSRVLNNVIKNAISYSFEHTDIIIHVTCINEEISISIQNEGYTIPENKLNSIFEKFYRLDDSRGTHTGGAGLGLAIAKEIITLHGGNIRAESKDNQTTFVITFPQYKR